MDIILKNDQKKIIYKSLVLFLLFFSSSFILKDMELERIKNLKDTTTLDIESHAPDSSKPNIVFLISEDNSKHFMDLFDPSGVGTPHIRRMAEEGVIYSHAFSNSPVCSVARSTLITGTLATRTGMHLHRKIALAPMPEGLKMFPAYLRKAGYFTTNNFKKDYNAVEEEGVWDASSNLATWRDRNEKDQPFFHQETFTGSHESRLHFERQMIKTYQPYDNPESVNLFPYYPDTPTFRYTVAYHRDKIRDIDNWVGNTLRKLEEDGLLEDTFVFYFGDHGGVLPGSKGYLYETGLHVPLVVMIPENFKHLVQVDKGDIQKGFVSFIDFAPTSLNLAGIPIPEQMDGLPFLGPGLDKKEVLGRSETLGYADRFDEKYEMVRSLRRGKFKYIRSYQPFYPDALQNNYRYKMMAFEEWRDLFQDGQLDSLQSRFFLAKPVEMLFDLESDPLETKNLSGDTIYQETLQTLRSRLQFHLLEKNDLGFLPESMLVDEAMENPVKYGMGFKSQLEKLLQINGLAFRPFDLVKEELALSLKEGNPLEKYWTITVASGFGKQASELESLISPLTAESNNLVRLRAIEFLGIIGKKNPLEQLTDLINSTPHPVEALHALNTLVYFKDHTPYGADFVPGSVLPINNNEEVKRRLDYLNGNW